MSSKRSYTIASYYLSCETYLKHTFVHVLDGEVDEQRFGERSGETFNNVVRKQRHDSIDST